MHLPRHTIESHASAPLFQHASFSCPDSALSQPHAATRLAQSGAHRAASTNDLSQPPILSCASLNGFLVAHASPLRLVANRSWSHSQGGLSHAIPVQRTSLLFLVGGGRVPRFAPNKVILWDEAAEYTAKPSTGTSRGVESDDDDTDSVSSRRASTIFSAGGEFDAYAKPQSDDLATVRHDKHPKASSRRSSSPVDGVRFSTSSLVDADEDRPHPHNRDLVHDLGLARGIDSSSIGIGRLEASYLSDLSHPEVAADSASHGRYPSDLTSSACSHSITASSANLADPFAQDAVQAKDTDGSPRTVPFSDSNPSSSPSRSSDSFHCTDTSSVLDVSPHPRLFPSQSSRQADAGLVDSVSSMATTATHATAQAPPQIIRGREVAELEFSEVVRGVYATSVHTGSLKAAPGNLKERGRVSADATSFRRAGPSQSSVVLVVLLTTKAIVFELHDTSATTKSEGRQVASPWKVLKRAVVQTYKNPTGLGSVAPCYAATPPSSLAPSSAIVAVPGRQKGHVQLLQIMLQRQQSGDTSTILSNPSSSAGAASIIVAHESSIAAIALSPDGRMLATASSKGTLIRIWSNNITVDAGRRSTGVSKPAAAGRTGFGANLAHELRRGTDPATILSIAFAPDASLVAAASDKGTIHIFLLSGDSRPSQTAARTDGSPSSPSSSSRAANLGRAAAQYLPAGLGNLAGQIPSSVLPQYLKSEWSSAQYRIPLKSFGASWRHYSATTSADDGATYATGAVPASHSGTEKSTEGAWAQMRGRISDIRKGEASVDEKIFLCWIVEAKASSGPTSPSTSKGSRLDVQTARTEKLRPPASSSAAEAGRLSDENDAGDRYRLIAVTTSGGWYKLAISLPRATEHDSASGFTVLDMYRRDASPNTRQTKAEKEKAMTCQLLEYRPMAALTDGWRA